MFFYYKKIILIREEVKKRNLNEWYSYSTYKVKQPLPYSYMSYVVYAGMLHLLYISI